MKTAELAEKIRVMSLNRLHPFFVPPAELVGAWHGMLEIFGPFRPPYDARLPAPNEYSFFLQVGDSGEVSGQIGEADVTSGIIQPHRGWIARARHTATDYIVRGMLEGRVTAHDSGGTRELEFPCDLVNGELTGTVVLMGKIPLARPARLRKTMRPFAANYEGESI